MSGERIPVKGDVIRRNMPSGYPVPWYGVVTVVSRGTVWYHDMRDDYPSEHNASSFLLSANDYNEESDESGWCFADPNREDHQDIPSKVWEIRKKLIQSE